MRARSLQESRAKETSRSCGFRSRSVGRDPEAGTSWPGVQPSPRGPFLQGPERHPPPGAEASTRFLWGDTDVQPVAAASDSGSCFGIARKGGEGDFEGNALQASRPRWAGE